MSDMLIGFAGGLYVAVGAVVAYSQVYDPFDGLGSEPRLKQYIAFALVTIIGPVACAHELARWSLHHIHTWLDRNFWIYRLANDSLFYRRHLRKVNEGNRKFLNLIVKHLSRDNWARRKLVARASERLETLKTTNNGD